MASTGSSRRERKGLQVKKLKALLDEYKNVLIVTIDNVGSNQMQKVRIALRGKAVVLMGKNTLIKKIVRETAVANPALETLLPMIVGNIGFVFTNDNLSDVRKLILTNKVPAAAKSGSFAPDDVHVPAGPTGLDPGQTNFFQALNIATKIVKGTIEIINPVHLIKKGDKVTSSHVALLTKLNILPFFYGFGVTHVWENGTVYDASILDMSPSDLMSKFLGGASRLAALSLAISYPTQASLPHLLNGAFKKLVSVALATSITFKEAESFKEYAADPSKFAKAAGPATGGAAAAGGAAAKVEAPKEKSEESEADMGFSLFD
jgi:large subunit ribosomal protein LP0